MPASRLPRHVLILAAAAVLAIGVALPAAAADLPKQFFGSFVGSGTAENLAEKTTEKRDLDVTIEPFKSNGFSMHWITVVRDEDGKRTGDGVKRREVAENFLPFEGRQNIYVLAPEGGLFKRAELPNPLRGEPMRWATIENDTITVHSIAIGESGESHMQVYRRTLTDGGMDVSYLRLENEKIIVRLTGELTKAK